MGQSIFERGINIGTPDRSWGPSVRGESRRKTLDVHDGATIDRSNGHLVAKLVPDPNYHYDQRFVGQGEQVVLYQRSLPPLGTKTSTQVEKL